MKSIGLMAVVVSHPLEVRELPDKTVLPVGGVVRGVYASPSQAEEALKLFCTLNGPGEVRRLRIQEAFPYTRHPFSRLETATPITACLLFSST